MGAAGRCQLHWPSQFACQQAPSCDSKDTKVSKGTHVPPAALTQCTAVKHREVYDWDTATIYQRRHIIKLKSIFFSPLKLMTTEAERQRLIRCSRVSILVTPI